MGSAVGTPSALSRSGLSREQHLHFSEHGWVMLDGVIEPELCQRIQAAIERLDEMLTCGPSRHPSDRGNLTAFREPHLLEPTFYELYAVPGLLAAARQIIGHNKIRYIQSIVTAVDPDHERHLNPAVVNDRRKWGWHRCFRPKSLLTPHDSDPGLINAAMVTIGMYFVPIGPEHGVTAFFDKAHTYDGPWDNTEEAYDKLSARYEVVQPSGGAGSIVLFSDTMVHSSAPVLSEQRRFAHFAWLSVPWFKRYSEDPHLQPYFADEGVRDLFAPTEVMDPDADD